MKVEPGQPFSIGGLRLVLEQTDDGGFEIKESVTATKATLQDIGAAIDEKVQTALKKLRELSPQYNLILT